MERQIIRNLGLRSGKGRESLATETDAESANTYSDRLLKLIPAETVVVYVSLQGILESALSASTDKGQLVAWLWGAFVAVILLNLLYLKRFHNVRDPIQLAVLTTALIIWVMSVGGPFRYLDFYRPFMGAVLLGLFTFAAPVLYKGMRVQ